jgi:hypothetical protein
VYHGDAMGWLVSRSCVWSCVWSCVCCAATYLVVCTLVGTYILCLGQVDGVVEFHLLELKWYN